MTKAQSAVSSIAPLSAGTATVKIGIVIANNASRGSTESHSQGPMQEVQSPADFEDIRQWALGLDPKPSVGRQRRIAEGLRQTAALARARDGLRGGDNGGGQQACCPVTGGYCGEKGYGPYGVHSACAVLDISTYCE
ncbi:hypothetical protein HOY82DRAFT_614851 [Tuber indicum]|nr:hypothetical protein HOY82DRAFT_614851 [Tuber indicum]